MDPVAIVKSAYEAFGRGDIDAVLTASSPDILWISNADPALLPWGGVRRGRDVVRGFFAALSEHIEFLAFEPREFHASANCVTVLGFTRGRMRGTGRIWESQWAQFFRVSGGSITEFREFYDTHAMVAAFAPDKAA